MLFGHRVAENQPFNMASIPQDCVDQILAYLPEGGGATRQFRTEKPHIKEYLSTHLMGYSSQNLKYFNSLFNRPDPRTVPQRLAGVPINIPARLQLRPEECRHQCCALTTRRGRCKNKTFGLFCSRHEGSTACYWTTPSSLYPAH